MEPGTRKGSKDASLRASPLPTRRLSSTFGRHVALPLTEDESEAGPLTAEEEARAAGKQLRAQIGDPYGRRPREPDEAEEAAEGGEAAAANRPRVKSGELALSALSAAGLSDDEVHRLLRDASPEGRAAAIAGEGPHAVMAGAGLNAARGTHGAGEPDEPV